MKLFIELNNCGKIVRSGFEKFSPNAILTTQSYTIEDCALEGTPFQIKVWNAIAQIPVGKTKTYGELVAVCGGAPQAIGSACGKNKIPVVIPCHRVVGKKNKLAYSGGSEIKRKLLELEGIKI